MKKIYMLLAAVLLVAITGCGSGGDTAQAPPSSANAITAFSLNGIAGKIDERGKTITVYMPPGTDVAAMVETFITTGTSVKVGSIEQISGATIDYFKDTDTVTYTVSAADATTKDYTVTVTVSSSLAGFLDTTFDTDGIVTTPIGSSDDSATAIAIQLDGKIVAAGISKNGNNYDFALVRYNEDGTLDSTFGTNGIVTTPIGSSGYAAAYALAIQLDRKIVAAGISKNGNKNNFTLVRYNENGILDSTFGTNGIVAEPVGSFDDVARAISIQSNGKIVVAGYSYYNSRNYDFALVRYNENGTLDSTFGTNGIVTTPVGSGVYAAAYALGIQLDSKIVAAGRSYDNFNSNNDFALVRYNENGTLDSTFGTNGIVTTPVGSLDGAAATALAAQSDGKIVAAGISYDAFNSNSDFVLVRYNTDGSLDTGYYLGGIAITSIGSGLDVATALGIRSDPGDIDDGKIVVAGYSYNVSTTNYDFALVRYLP